MISISPRPQNADCIGDYKRNKPNDVREYEIHMEMSTSVADGHNREDVGRQTFESTAKSYLGRIPAFLGDLQSSKSHQVFTELG